MSHLISPHLSLCLSLSLSLSLSPSLKLVSATSAATAQRSRQHATTAISAAHPDSFNVNSLLSQFVCIALHLTSNECALVLDVLCLAFAAHIRQCVGESRRRI